MVNNSDDSGHQASMSGEEGPETEARAPGSRAHQLLASILACVPMLSYGAAMGWVSPHAVLLRGPLSPARPPLSAADVSWLASVIFVLAPLAVFAFGAAVDRVGRKYSLMAVSVPMALGWVVKLCSSQAGALIAARALIGFGAGGAFVVCPLYIKEISDDRIRGMTGTFLILSQSLGNLVVFVLGEAASYRATLWALLAPPAAHALLAAWLPETPSYLLKQGKHKEAARVVGWLHSLPAEHKLVAATLERLAAEEPRTRHGFSPRMLYKDSAAMKAFRVALTVNLAREFCGVIVVLVYASRVFAAADRQRLQPLSPNQQSVLLALVQILGSFGAGQLVDRLGRKPLLCVSSAVAGCSMCVLGAWFYLQGGEGEALPGWLPLLALCVSVLADASALQPLPFVIMTEMFSFQFRGTVATIIMATHLVVDFALLKLAPLLISSAGYHTTFWLFSGVCFSTLAYLLLFLPETKRRSLDAIYADLQRPTMCSEPTRLNPSVPVYVTPNVPSKHITCDGL